MRLETIKWSQYLFKVQIPLNEKNPPLGISFNLIFADDLLLFGVIH